MKEKLISIVTPVHNSEEYLNECMDSVSFQTHKNWEHILVDDCSTDNSAALIKERAAKDSRIYYVKLEKNSGAGVARNTAIKMAKGDYIAFLDSDDLWDLNKLEKQLAFMQIGNYPFTFTSYSRVNEMGSKLPGVIRAMNKVTYKKALYKNPIGCLTAMYDVHFFGKQYMPEIRKRQDFALWLKLLKKSNGHGLNESLAYYRVGNKSISSNKFNLLKYEWQIYRGEGFSKPISLFYVLSAILLKFRNNFK